MNSGFRLAIVRFSLPYTRQTPSRTIISGSFSAYLHDIYFFIPFWLRSLDLVGAKTAHSVYGVGDYSSNDCVVRL